MPEPFGADGSVVALAIGKFYSSATLPPMLLYLTPPDAWYRWLFLIFPTTPIVNAYEAFRASHNIAACQWLIWGTVYSVALTALAIRRYLRKSYLLG